MSAIFNSIFYQPLYNGLIFLIALLPWIDAGTAVVLFTFIVKLILFPLSRKAVRAQLEMKKLEPELAKIRKTYADNKEEQARKVMSFYKDKKVNPFSSFFLVLIQLPIVIALYRVFIASGLPSVNTSLLYTFISAPQHIGINFLGLTFLDITQRSYILAFFAGITSYIQIRISTGGATAPATGEKSFGNDLMRSMQTQMKYVFPVMVFFIAYRISGAVALYWFTSNVFTIFQELIVKRKLSREGRTALNTS